MYMYINALRCITGLGAQHRANRTSSPRYPKLDTSPKAMKYFYAFFFVGASLLAINVIITGFEEAAAGAAMKGPSYTLITMGALTMVIGIALEIGFIRVFLKQMRRRTGPPPEEEPNKGELE
jgi:hypothetical protein